LPAAKRCLVGVDRRAAQHHIAVRPDQVEGRPLLPILLGERRRLLALLATTGDTLMVTQLDRLAEFERDLIRPLSHEEGGRAEARRVEPGRTPKLAPRRRKAGIQRRDGGDETSREIARSYDVGRTTTQRLTVCGLTANGRDRDVPHRCVRLGAMPMAFTGLDMHDVTDIDLSLFMLRRHHAGARSDHQDLVAVMGMPSGGAAVAEVHHAAVVVRGIPGLNDRLT
jgi:hypothetical protein